MEKRILIVDDEVAIGKLLEKAFTIAGFSPTIADSAEEALSIAEKEKFEVFFIDIKLPKMSGIELCKLLKKDNPASFFFSMTGYASVYDLVKCREAGFDDYFIKPFKLEYVVKVVSETFEKVERWEKSKNADTES